MPEKMKSDNIVDVRNLTKRFGRVTALNSVDLGIRKGEIFALLGPNGAGKTTLISILATLLKPTSGTASVGMHDVLSEPGKVRASIGIVFQESILDLDLSAYDNLDFHGRLYHVPGAQRKKRIEEVIKLVGLSEQLGKKVSTFSGGMKRRLETARGLLHKPEILFLDEPTLGLDPQTRRHIWEYLLQLRQKSR